MVCVFTPHGTSSVGLNPPVQKSCKFCNGDLNPNYELLSFLRDAVRLERVFDSEASRHYELRII
jgi:hypothetical protein